MSVVNIISAIGDNDSVYPLLVRDCGIENVAKCVLTYKQNAKESKFAAREATRERIIDEYGTSAVWLGGVPLLNTVSDKIIKKCGYAPEINLKLFNESGAQGMNLNIEKFKDKLPEITKQMEKVRDNKNIYQNLQLFKFFATTAIPIALMGFILPKLNFLYTKKRNEKSKENKPKRTTTINTNFDTFVKSTKKSSQPSFKGVERLVNMTNLQKMMVLDGGLTVGRVRTGRTTGEKAELGLKMALMCYLNYVAPKHIEKMFNKLTKTIFGINTDLDIKLLNDKDFMEKIKNNALLLPKGSDEKAIIEFIDSNINSDFVQQAKKLKLVSLLDGNVRDPRKYVQTDKIAQLKASIEQFMQDSQKSGNFEKFVKNAIKAKSFNILANVALSSFLLAGVLPKIQFWFRKKITNSDIDPGIKQYVDNQKSENNQ